MADELENNSRLLNIKQTSQFLHISESTLRRLVDKDQIPKPIKIGKRVLWDKEKLEKWIDDQNGHDKT